MEIDIRPAGACAALAVLGDRICETTGARVAALDAAVCRARIAGVTETVPAFASLLVRYDPLRTDFDAVSEALRRLTEREQSILRMRFFEGRTQMEVAGEIGISQAQVSRLEKNALQHMRKYVSES